MQWLTSLSPYISIPALIALVAALWRLSRWVAHVGLPALDASQNLIRCQEAQERADRDYTRLDGDYKKLEAKLEAARFHMAALEASIADYEARLVDALNDRAAGITAHPDLSPRLSTSSKPPLASEPPSPPPTTS